MWANDLSHKEAEFTEKAIKELHSVEWAKPLVNLVDKLGGLKSKNLPYLFEIRFAYAIYKSGYQAEYEYKAGVGDYSIDFNIQASDKNWLIELVTIQESDAVKRATVRKQIAKGIEEFTMDLSTNADDPTQSEEGEMLLVQQKIGEKVFSKREPIKFPRPQDNFYNVILVNARGFLGDGGGDQYDYRHIVYGARGLEPHYIRYWDGTPIKGLFEENNPLQAANTIRERIHFIGFIAEDKFEEHEIQNNSCYLSNNHLFLDKEYLDVWKYYPLRKEVKP